MATSNTQVTTYLPDHILEYVEKYCIEYGITRKKDDKPLLATGIVDLLNILVNIPIEDLPNSNDNISTLDIEDTIEKKLSDSKVVSKLLDTLLSDSTLRQRLIDVLLPVTANTEPDNAPNTLSNTLPVTYENKENEIDRLPVDNENPYVKSICASEVKAVTETENKVNCDSANDKEIVEEAIVESKEIKELTDKQKKVMSNISNIPAGGKFSYNSLAKTLGVSRSVLDKFEDWQPFFSFDGKQYSKL